MSIKRRSDRPADRVIDALLRRSLRAEKVSAGADCFDAETVAAWMDGALSSDERSAAEAHAAVCPHCQAMLAAMARTAPATPSPAWLNATAVRWLVPIAAASVVFAVWISTDRQAQAPPRSFTESARVTAVAEQPAPSTSVPVDSGAAARETRTRATEKGKLKAPVAQAPRSAAAPPRGLMAEPNASPVAGRVVGGVAVDALSSKTPAPAAPPPLAPAPAPAAAAAAPRVTSAPATPPADVLPGAAESVTVTSEKSASRLSARDEMRMAARVVPMEVSAPDRAVRWRTGTAGVVLHSTDGGNSWTSHPTGTPAVLRAGSAPSHDVCWIVGQFGTVLLSTDGNTWQIRPFPERVDLTAIRAIDAKTAVVTAADGRRFSTTDGGATWSKLPLQEK